MPSSRYLFGPVHSRRYGRSLGVDLAAPKTCTLNCRFCQLGPTPHTTVTRTDTPPMSEILAELRAWLAEHPGPELPDFITAAGSGEPTLHLRFGDLLRFVRVETPCRSLLLTNGSLFFLDQIRDEAALADIVKISLHAWDQDSFERISRPHPSLRFDAIVDGYRAFRQQFSGRLDLEVFVIPGMNDRPEDAQRIAAIAQTFAPDTVTLNTAVRPPADSGVTTCPPEHLRTLSAFFGPAATAAGDEPAASETAFSEDALVALVSRHPISVQNLAETFRLPETDLLAILETLAAQHRLSLFLSQGRRFAGPFASTEQPT